MIGMTAGYIECPTCNGAGFKSNMGGICINCKTCDGLRQIPPEKYKKIASPKIEKDLLNAADVLEKKIAATKKSEIENADDPVSELQKKFETENVLPKKKIKNSA